MDELEKVTEAMETETTEVLNEQAALDENQEESVAEQTETDDISAEAQDTDEVVQTDVMIDDTAAPVEEQAPKKKFILQRCIIIASCILLSALVVFGGFIIVKNLLTPSIESVWVMKKVYLKGHEKEAQTTGTKPIEAIYYQFKDNGDFIYRTGTVTNNMKWTYADSSGKFVTDKTQYISVYAKGYESQATQYKFKCEGNAFSDRKLTLEAGTDTVQVYKFDSYDGSELPEYKMKPDKNFKPDKKLVGEWYDKSSKQTLIFNEDGSYILKVDQYFTQKGNYTYDTKKKTLTLKLVDKGQETSTGDLPYSFKKDKLVIANYKFTKK